MSTCHEPGAQCSALNIREMLEAGLLSSTFFRLGKLRHEAGKPCLFPRSRYHASCQSSLLCALAATRLTMPTLFSMCLWGRQGRPFRVQKSAWVPQQSSHHSGYKGNIGCQFQKPRHAQLGRAPPHSALTADATREPSGARFTDKETEIQKTDHLAWVTL